jgi:ABC-type transport system involved in multi-copper enzyme maturation permease subunit
MAQTLAIARLQLTLLSRKRFILALVALWLIRLVFVLELGRSGVSLPLLLPSLYLADLLVVVMACGLVADDAERGTFPFVLSHGIDRRTFLTGKLLPVVALAIAFSILAHAATLILLPAPKLGGVAGASGRLVLASGLSLVRILVVTAVTAWMAVLFTNRYVASIAALAYIYGLSWLLQSVLSPASPGVWLAESLLPWRDSFDRAAAGLLSGSVSPGTIAVSAAQPLVYAVLFGVLAERSLSQRDLARADA